MAKYVQWFYQFLKESSRKASEKYKLSALPADWFGRRGGALRLNTYQAVQVIVRKVCGQH